MKSTTVQINEVYAGLYDLRVRFIVCYGGRDSGKSYGVSQLLGRRALEYPGRRIVAMRKVGTTIRLSVWERLRNMLTEFGWLKYCRQNKSEKEIQLPNGSTFICLGADDPEKLKSIEGITDYWLEEATEFTEHDFDTINIGLRAPADPPPQVWLSHNPIPVVPGYQHWIQRRFLNVPHKLGELVVRDDAAILRTWYKHNRFCSPATTKQIESYRETNPLLWRMWGLGEFVTLEGVILQPRSVETPEVAGWDIVEAVPPGIEFLGYGLDFGFANDEAAVIGAWRHNDDVWLREMVYQLGLTNPDLSAEMELCGIRKGYDDIIADSAEPKSIKELADLGWSVRGSEKSPDYKRAAAQYLRALNIHILEGSANLIREAATWSWKRNRQRNILPVPEDGNDHAIDAVIYRVYRAQPGQLPRTTTRGRPVTAGMRSQKF